MNGRHSCNEVDGSRDGETRSSSPKRAVRHGRRFLAETSPWSAAFCSSQYAQRAGFILQTVTLNQIVEESICRRINPEFHAGMSDPRYGESKPVQAEPDPSARSASAYPRCVIVMVSVRSDD